MPKTVIVDIAGGLISDSPDEILVTYSLGSCLGVTFYDPVLRIGAMTHCMLPLSQLDIQKAEEKPYMFVDVGVPKILQHMFERGCRKSNVITRIAGVAQVIDDGGLFRIGERNYAVFRKIMWKNGMLIKAEDVGGAVSRTLRLEIATGRLSVRSQGKEQDL